MTVRVRFAPSPTGIPHIGNTRTALFNWLFAKHHGGKFIVRIEDTDQKRLVPGSREKIMAILDILGLKEDESYRVGGKYGPYIQSQRLDIYQRYARQLIDLGKAYYCFCSPDRLSQVRKDQQKRGQAPKYDRHCLSLSKDEVEKRIKAGEAYVVRLKVPDDVKVSWQDVIQGSITIKTENIDDQVLLKSDGYPTYHLAVVVDDHLMKISHVLRGSEWISSTPKHILLYQAFGWDLPKFGHFPVILGPDKSKLAKRHGAKSVFDYVAEGYLPEALVNFMAFLGWNYKDNSAVLGLNELIKVFDLDKVGKSNPIFDIDKLKYFNKEHIKKLPAEELAKRIKQFLPEDFPVKEESVLIYLARLCQVRMTTLTDFLSLTEFVYPDKKADEKVVKKRIKDPIVIGALVKIKALLENLSEWTPEAIEAEVKKIVEAHSWPKGKVYMGLRVAVLINPVTPPLFESMAVLDRQVVIDRIADVLKLTHEA
ncbi:MAG: glutamate--tRNA ligase [bacterium]|nr:glutamate--tRNA ligase [bacterium]